MIFDFITILFDELYSKPLSPVRIFQARDRFRYRGLVNNVHRDTRLSSNTTHSISYY